MERRQSRGKAEIEDPAALAHRAKLARPLRLPLRHRPAHPLAHRPAHRPVPHPQPPELRRLVASKVRVSKPRVPDRSRRAVMREASNFLQLLALLTQPVRKKKQRAAVRHQPRQPQSGHQALGREKKRADRRSANLVQTRRPRSDARGVRGLSQSRLGQIRQEMPRLAKLAKLDKPDKPHKLGSRGSRGSRGKLGNRGKLAKLGNRGKPINHLREQSGQQEHHRLARQLHRPPRRVRRVQQITGRQPRTVRRASLLQPAECREPDLGAAMQRRPGIRPAANREMSNARQVRGKRPRGNRVLNQCPSKRGVAIVKGMVLSRRRPVKAAGAREGRQMLLV